MVASLARKTCSTTILLRTAAYETQSDNASLKHSIFPYRLQRQAKPRCGLHSTFALVNSIYLIQILLALVPVGSSSFVQRVLSKTYNHGLLGTQKTTQRVVSAHMLRYLMEGEIVQAAG
jgi:hypothetical protein